SRVTKNVPQVIVPKHARCPKVAAKRMVTVDVQVFAADLAMLSARDWARQALVEQRDTEAKFQRRTESVARHAQAQAWNRCCKKPVAGVAHRAGEKQVLRSRGTALFESLQSGIVQFVGKQALPAE